MDSFEAARIHREISVRAEQKRAHDVYIPHGVQPYDAFDLSLTSHLVYNDRVNWQAVAPVCRFFDVSVPTNVGTYRFLPPYELIGIVSKNDKDNGMVLY